MARRWSWLPKSWARARDLALTDPDFARPSLRDMNRYNALDSIAAWARKANRLQPPRIW